MENRNLTCSTLVFFDLETTGIPTFQSKTRITELCMCSVERSQFLETRPGRLPRVTNRLNLCIYPFRAIDPAATEKTLLDNWNLEHQSPFNNDIYNIISSFLNRLQGPICLIAHNGLKFDFPILKSEIERLEKKLPENLFCADSLLILKQIHQREHLQLHSPLLPHPTVIKPADLEDQMMQVENGINPFQLINERTPEKGDQQNDELLVNNRVKRRLPFSDRPKFDLGSIYERTFGVEFPQSHQAEADVQALMMIAISKGADFIKEVDLCAAPFEGINKCW